MNKQIRPYEIGKIAMLLWELLSLAAVVYGIYQLCYNAVQVVLIPIGVFAEQALASITQENAKTRCVIGAIVFVVGLISFFVAKGQLRRLELRYKKKFLPLALAQSFSDFTYQPEKRRQEEEVLCEVGMLRYSERYYSANRLKGMYRGCWVACEEIVCGGVYGENYTSHKVCVRGQWMSVRLNHDFDGTVIVEARNTKNRFTHRKLAKTMCEVQFQDKEAFGDYFRCYATSAKEAGRLISNELAQKLLQMTEEYPDFCLVFRKGCLHILLRRRSFNRRLEPFVPFGEAQLHRECDRLYGALQEFTDMLLA